MNRFLVLLIAFLVLPFLAFLGSPNAYALGHYGISGTVEGCNECHDFETGTYDGSVGNLRWVKSPINSRSVVFTSFDTPPGDTLADGNDGQLDGPCEVCHTSTSYHTNTGDDVAHYDGQNCTLVCHPHFLDDINNYFEPRFVGGQSHTTHFADPKGPQLEIKRPSDYCTYFCHDAGDFTLFIDGQPLGSTNVCDDCHSANGVAVAKDKWIDGVYESNGHDLKLGEEGWCGTCHDGDTSVVDVILAPNVMGDNTTYGYNISGHGKDAVLCKDCHDFAVLHTDGDPRTYSAASNNYRDGYRLNDDMAVPRYGEQHPAAFRLCTNCHVYTDIIGPTSNFRDDGSGMQHHELHLTWYSFLNNFTDSDFDNTYLNDSAITCINCHNVHGSPTGAMTRHGELISPPGTTDKVPALDFKWYRADGSTPTSLLEESMWGSLFCGVTPYNPILQNNYVCVGCHPTGELKWQRTPGGPVEIKVLNVWTTNLADGVQNSFSVGEDIRFHATFQISGPGSYFIQSPAKISRAYNTSEADWYRKLWKTETLSEGIYEWTWDKTIPSGATPGSGAEAKVRLKMWDIKGGTVLDKNLKKHTFSIAP